MNKNGFTLIELLAVILILGIIALIAVPQVNNVIDDARIGAFNTSLTNLENKIIDMCNLELIKGKEITSHYTIRNGISIPKIEIKGNIPDGNIFVDNNCNISYELSDNSFVANKNNEENVEIVKCTKNACFEYSEGILNSAKPSLLNGMIPVNIENNGVVKKADIYSEWYSYEQKLWANAVIVSDSTLDLYQKADSKTIIKPEDIVGYFVWIPRYKYQISTSGTNATSEINIVFENKYSEKSYGNAITSYRTHPGFEFGSEKFNGLWVAKFETTGTNDNPTILPSKSTLRNQNVYEQYSTSLLFNNKITTNNAHMMKNSEWGAIAYLSRSKYGINTKIRINNN